MWILFTTCGDSQEMHYCAVPIFCGIHIWCNGSMKDKCVSAKAKNGCVHAGVCQPSWWEYVLCMHYKKVRFRGVAVPSRTHQCSILPSYAIFTILHARQPTTTRVCYKTQRDMTVRLPPSHAVRLPTGENQIPWTSQVSISVVTRDSKIFRGESDERSGTVRERSQTGEYRNRWMISLQSYPKRIRLV